MKALFKIQRVTRTSLFGMVLVLVTSLYTGVSLAETSAKSDADNQESKSRQASIDRFKTFMQDKNIQTLPKGPDGKPIKGNVKLTPNKDDKNPFESDLTYHDRSITIIELVKDPNSKDPNATKVEIQKEFKSPHGKIAAGGGSSALERKSEEVDARFEEQDKKEQKDPEEGVSYDGMFKRTTKEVKEKDIQKKKKDPNDKSAPIDTALDKSSKDKEDEFITVSRKEIREEALKDFQDVGKNSADTIIQSARDPEKKTDQNALANGVLLRVAAAENLMALWRSTLANLTQRRANKAIAPLAGLREKIEMDEETPNCDQWAAKAKQKIAEEKLPEESKKNIEKDLEQMISQCKEIGSMPFNTINPKYVPDEESGAYKLSIEGAKSEDGIERDSRVQLEVMARAGTSATESENNWGYETKDDKVKMNRYDEKGNPQEIETTAAEELESYNNQLRKAKEGYADVAKRLGGFQPPDPTQYEIQKGQKSMMDVSQAPESTMDEFGIAGRGSMEADAPETYQQLQNGPQ